MLKRIATLGLLLGILLSQVGSTPLRADRHRGYEVSYRVTYEFPEDGITITYLSFFGTKATNN
jgi:hypothetical protein